jgi:hypothetical protein
MFIQANINAIWFFSLFFTFFADPAKILTWDSPYSRLVQNDSYNMVVYIQGNPPPDQILLISNQTGKVLFRDKGDGRRNITLKSVQCGDSGTYHLYAVNDLDTDVFTKDITMYCKQYIIFFKRRLLRG